MVEVEVWVELGNYNNQFNETRNIEYEEILSENAENQLLIAKLFQTNMKILEKLKNGWRKFV